MLAHECAGLAQIGGLGEAVAGLARTLAKDSKLEITVFLPSHGRHLDPQVRASYRLEDVTTFIAHGARRGVNGANYPYLAGVERGLKDYVNYFLVRGLDAQTSKWLDNRVIYDHDLTFEKMALFARTLRTFAEYLLATSQQRELPDLIHVHDWHMVPAGVALKQFLRERGLTIPLVFTIHLLGRIVLPWHFASEAWCGIKDARHIVWTGKKEFSMLSYRQVWEDLSHGSLEEFGSYEADYLTSVSNSYLMHDVHEYVGSQIAGKSGHIYNGCDWDYKEIESSVRIGQLVRSEPHEEGNKLSRWELRKYLLTRGLAQARPIIVDEESQTVSQDNQGADVTQLVETFKEDGPLVLMTGRLSPQKGVDILLDAVPMIVKVLPKAKFLLFLLPSNDPSAVHSTVLAASSHPENVRLVFGRDRPVYLMSHVSADAYAMPSRSEPFGISALEAMVTGNPVVGTDVGGIRETVLDITRHGETATGIVVPPESASSLAASIISLLIVMEIDELSQRGRLGDARNSARKLPSKLIREMVRKNPRLGSKIRENCRRRVEEYFRWKNAGLMALDRYGIAAGLAAAKASASIAHKRTLT